MAAPFGEHIPTFAPIVQPQCPAPLQIALALSPFEQVPEHAHAPSVGPLHALGVHTIPPPAPLTAVVPEPPGPALALAGEPEPLALPAVASTTTFPPHAATAQTRICASLIVAMLATRATI